MSDSITKLVVQGTFGLLLFGSVLTWALVLLKARQRWVSRAQDRRFLRAAGTPVRLAFLRTLSNHQGPTWRLSRAGLTALADVEPHDDRPGVLQDAVERALQSQIARERRSSEAGLAVLASIGSTAPFVGLFGTVFGIINALRAIGSSGSASLEVVAKPIGEALVATGIGIAVAVPAVLTYNYFVRKLKLQVSDLEQYGSGFVGAVARGLGRTELRVEGGGFDTRREASV